MRAILFLIIMPIHFILGLPLLILTFLIGFFNRGLRRKLGYQYNRLTAWLMMAISGAKIHVTGSLPTDSNFVIVSNHRSMLDIPVIINQSKTPIVFVARKSVAKWPFLGWWVSAMDCALLDRKNNRAALKTMLSAIDRIKEGETFAIFPEGTRCMEETMLPFKQGSMKLASKTNVPVVPISVTGTAAVFEKNGFNLKPEHVYLNIGTPININELPADLQKTSAKYVQNIIEDMLKAHLD